MNLQNLKSVLSTSINPEIKNTGKYRLASVLVVIYGDAPYIIMTEKPSSMKFHAGEIAFPGGKLDDGDENLLETALRETKEELGLKISPSDVVGQLEPVVTLNSGFLILPFVSIVDKISDLTPNSEVEQIFHIPLASFLKTAAPDTDPLHNGIQEMYTYEYQNKIVWGASARILKQIENLLNS